MAAETVIVGCKLPNGLLLSVAGKTIRINGRARYNMPSPTRRNLNTDVEAGDGLTLVDKSFWDTWLAEHKEYGPVVSGHVYASPSRTDAVAKAKDTQENKTGFEPADPAKPGAKLEPTEELKKTVAAVAASKK